MGTGRSNLIRLTKRGLGGLPWDIRLVYLDDIIVHARSFDLHLDQHVCWKGCGKQI